MSPPPPPSGAVAAPGTVIEHRWGAMGTHCHVLIHTDEPGADVAAMVVELVEDLEARWSRFRPTSELARINAAAGAPVAVSDLTLLAVQAALDARRRTDGRFDPTILPALRSAGYDRDFDEVAMRSSTGAVLAGPASLAGSSVAVDLEACTVAVGTGAALDLGGIGKGLAADLAATTMLAAPGVHGICVNLGGDLRAVGEAPTPSGWGIAIEDPAEPTATLATVALAHGGLATSSTRRRRWTASGRPQHHVIDPARGLPVEGAPWSATVIAASAAEAEVLATVALVSGAAGATFLEEAGVAALLVDPAGIRRFGAIGEYLR